MAMVELPLLLLPLLFIPSLEAICLAHHCIVVVVTQDWQVGRLVGWFDMRRQCGRTLSSLVTGVLG